MKEIHTIGRRDFLWSDLGDFIVESGDIKDSRELQGLGFIEEIKRRFNSAFGDWKLSEEDGANLHVYKNRINNESTWKDISDALSFCLTKDNFLGPMDFQIFVAPISVNEVAVRTEFSDNIRRQIDPRLHNVRLIYNLDGEGPFIMR